MKYIETTTKEGFKVVQIVPETEEEIREREEEQRWWEENGCHCDIEYPTYFVPDGKSKECHKHHYRCSKCHKIVQIG